MESGPAPRGSVPLRFAQGSGWNAMHIAVEPGTSLYGTGEQPGRLNRNGTRRNIWTTDCFGYEESMPSLYQAHPWVLAVRKNGSAFGVIYETTHRAVVDLRHGIFLAAQYTTADTQSPGAVIIEGESAAAVLKKLAQMTGRMPMPPRWALQFQQCRWSYETDARVRQIASEFRARRMPCGVLWMDIDYMFGFRCFTFDTERFPDPRGLNDHLHAIGFKSVWMIDPGLMTDDNYPAYRDGKRGDHFVKNRFGHDFVGKVWPGPCSFPDFTRRFTREWWASLYRDYMAQGIDGVWNDMNEPAVFDVPNKQMPESNVHDADPELGGPGRHLRYRNIYGMQMVRASRAGIQAANPEKRPFILTRSNFLGGHRYAATWTGDNKSNWRHLRWSIPMVLNMGLSGQPFVGPDIGGFADNADAELFARWMGIGTLLPFARAHSVKDSVDHEPWSFGPECEATCRAALERRSRLLPYLYTAFRESHMSGLPVARPVFFDDGTDPSLRSVDDAFLLGSALFVRCDVWEPGRRAAAARLPRGDEAWARFEPLDPAGISSQKPDPSLPELFLRRGSIIPLGPVMQFDGEKPMEPLTLVVALDRSGHASGTLYQDEGDGYGFEKGDFALTHFEASRTDRGVEVVGRQIEGVFPAVHREVEVIVLLPGGGRERGRYEHRR
ncbi:MAG: DUF5110 domain-containing protein [Planctomycetes bacterium]|nr:DUF5110 domain-containing protein [Planctomycetota bacterium]